jgi:hypothetical protein
MKEAHIDLSNTGAPWSERDLRDLRWCVEHKEPSNEIAGFLCRSQQEIIDKAKELGFELPK